MELWFIYGLIIAIMYALWSVLLENVSKNNKNCLCLILYIYILVGIISFIYLLYHIKYNCCHGTNLKDNLSNFDRSSIFKIIIVSFLIFISFIIINICFKKNINIVNVYAMSNLYIVLLLLYIVFTTDKSLNLKEIGGIIMIVGGLALL